MAEGVASSGLQPTGAYAPSPNTAFT